MGGWSPERIEKIMRIDHHAYKRATKVAGLGLLLQIAIGLLLLTFGFESHDAAFQAASIYVLCGVLVWLGLIIIFHQHKLERLEALEEDELASTRGGAGSFFEKAESETRVAARRLAQMHKWLMPAISILLALILTGLGVLIFRYMDGVRSGAHEFQVTDERGWAVALCLSIAAVSFIFSRFIAGMAKQAAWQNLRGGAAYMVGNALVMVAVAAGIIFRFFDNESVLNAVTWAIPIFMWAIVFEILLNFILNLYRPRIAGEVPRPAFDSKVLSLVATPDSLVRSLNEAVNYQFGFDVTSSWGYQLLLRSVVSLLAVGVIALVLMSMMVVIEPHQQAIKLRGGAIVDNRIHESGLMWKLPWPLETADIYDVTRIRSLHLTARVLKPAEVESWSEAEPPRTDEAIQPFIVGSPPMVPDNQSGAPLLPLADLASTAAPQSAPKIAEAPVSEEDKAVEQVSNFYSLVDADIVLQYRIRKDNNGLLDFLNFAPETVARRQALTDRERALRDLALAEVSGQLSRLSLDQALSPGLSNLAADLRAKVQAVFDARGTGVEVVAIDMPMLRPSGNSAPTFEELGISAQARQQLKALADRNVFATFTKVIGEASLSKEVLQKIDELDQLKHTKGVEEAVIIAKQQDVEKLLLQGGGDAAQTIADAQTQYWNTLMEKRAQDSRVRSQLAAFLAAPRLYMERETMNVYKQMLPFRQKYIIAIDPKRLNVGFDLQSPNPLLDFAGSVSQEELNKK